MQTTIVFTTSLFDELKMQIWYFIKVAVARYIVYDNMPASALDNVVTLAGEVLVELKEKDA